VTSVPDFDRAAALRAAVREFSHRSEKIIRRYDLTLEQYQLLLLLRVQPKEENTIGSLHRQLHRGQSAVTQLARRMENRGLITRELSKHDARIRFLKLTSRGDQRLTEAVTALEGERARLLELTASLDVGDGR
jgi:DNA-binding MarR family transcriptional regulator